MHDPLALAHRVAAQYGALPQVEAVAVAGSLRADRADARSDVDLYVYTRDEIPLRDRARIANAASVRAEVDNRTWEPGDEWIDAASGIHVDVMFRGTSWIEEQLARVLDRHEASTGYSTCFWANVLQSEPLHDPRGWYGALQQRARQPYPEELVRAIVAKNHPILRRNLSSYLHQIELAVARGDRVSVQHRVTALIASYFDILFALNRLPHPGEKRLLDIAARCARQPPRMREHITALIAASSSAEDLVIAANRLIDGLDEWVEG